MEYPITLPKMEGQEQLFNNIDMLAKDLPSQRINTSLENLEVFSTRDNCSVDMSTFFTVTDDVCFACLGGASAIERLLPGSDPVNFSSNVRLMLANTNLWREVERFELSVDNARTGNISSMFEVMGLNDYDGLPYNREITPYEDDPPQFICEMEQLADDLKKGGY